MTATGKRIPGLKLDNPRQLALMQALVRFAQIPAARTFSTAEIYPHTIAALGATTQHYRLASLRYDLSKLRVTGLVEKLPRSRRYLLSLRGYSICLIFLKLFERAYAPLSATRLEPVPGDANLPPLKHTLLDASTVASTPPSIASCTPSDLPRLLKPTRTKSSLLPP